MFKREVYSNIVLLQETKSLKQHNLTPKATRERGKKTQLVEGKKS